ncbi:thioesterase family protein [Bosea sp. TAB14]|uniref:thioesterase family protein n=1 Tax=Bosea sp. TAB14 TaxID=3237481 RepID=UPI003F910EE4
MQIAAGITVPAFGHIFPIFETMPPVFATAMLVAFAEWTCMEALRHYLGTDERTVGSAVDLSHLAATPIGMNVTAEVELIAVEKRRLRFSILCRDEVDVISRGIHERAIVAATRFDENLASKVHSWQLRGGSRQS